MIDSVNSGSAESCSTGKKIIIDADVSKLPVLQDFLDKHLENKNCPMSVTMEIQIAAEEMFANIANYAYPEGGGNMEVCISFTEGKPCVMTLVFTDSGVPFDPLAKTDPDVTLSAFERQVGGLGIYMTKKSMDDLAYVYQDGQNIFTM
ncbi:MAG: ATP-binding protein, partial [Eubacterium sp.]|nr:ATP-binding protein [Eubacterium sp.]